VDYLDKTSTPAAQLCPNPCNHFYCLTQGVHFTPGIAATNNKSWKPLAQTADSQLSLLQRWFFAEPLQ